MPHSPCSRDPAHRVLRVTHAAQRFRVFFLANFASGKGDIAPERHWFDRWPLEEQIFLNESVHWCVGLACSDLTGHDRSRNEIRRGASVFLDY